MRSSKIDSALPSGPLGAPFIKNGLQRRYRKSLLVILPVGMILPEALTFVKDFRMCSTELRQISGYSGEIVSDGIVLAFRYMR